MFPSDCNTSYVTSLIKKKKQTNRDYLNSPEINRLKLAMIYVRFE